MPFNKKTASAAGKRSSRAGVKNRLDVRLKDKIGAALESSIDRAIDELGELEGRDYLSAYLRLLEFIVPKQKAVEQTAVDWDNLSPQQQNDILDKIAEKMKE